MDEGLKALVDLDVQRRSAPRLNAQ